MAKRQTQGDNPLDAPMAGSEAQAAPEETAPEETAANESASEVEVSDEAAPDAPPPAEEATEDATAISASKTVEEATETPPASVDDTSHQDAVAEDDGLPKAVEPTAVDRSTSTLAVPEQCLTFTLAGEEYGVGILQLREIVEYETLTKVPTTPPWIRGVMNLRGTAVPVVDLAVKFGLPETEITARTCIVMVEADLDGEPTLMGVVVDAVVRVLDLSPDDVEAPPTFGTRVRVEYLLGVGKVDDQLVLVLDIDRVLSIDELLAVAATPATASELEGSAAGEEASIT